MDPAKEHFDSASQQPPSRHASGGVTFGDVRRDGARAASGAAQLARRNTYHAPLSATMDGGVERVLPYVASFSLDSFLEPSGGKCGLSTATAANGNGHPVPAARSSVDSRLSMGSTSSTSESGPGSGGRSPARIGARSTAAAANGDGNGNGHGRGTAANGNGHDVSAASSSAYSALSGHPLSDSSGRSSSCHSLATSGSPPRDGEVCADPRSSVDLDPSPHASTPSDGSEAAVVEESSAEAPIAAHTEPAAVPAAAAAARPSFPRGLAMFSVQPEGAVDPLPPRAAAPAFGSLLMDLSDVFAGVIAVDAPKDVQQAASQATTAEAAARPPAQLDGVILDFGPGTGTLAMTARLTTGVMRATDLIRGPAQSAARSGGDGGGACVVSAELRSQITAVVQSVLGDDVVNDPDEAFNVDSRLALRLHGVIEKATELTLPVTLCFDYPTVAAVADFVTDLLRADTDTPPPPQHLAAGEGAAVALCQVGAVRSKLPVSGAAIADSDSSQQPLGPVPDSLAHVPFARWDANVPPAFDSTTKPTARFGGFVEDVEEFDAQLFGCGSSEATLMDPQQRLLMELSMRALAAARVTSSFGGVVVGSFVHEYAALIPLERGPLRGSSFSATGISGSVMSGRLSFTYGLSGPSLTVQTACSSSLVATHLGCQSLAQRTATYTLAAGANLLLDPLSTHMFSSAGMLVRGWHKRLGLGSWVWEVLAPSHTFSDRWVLRAIDRCCRDCTEVWWLGLDAGGRRPLQGAGRAR